MPRPTRPELQELGANVKRRREELGLSQERVALGSGLHWSFFGQVERGTRNLSFLNLLRIAAALKIDAGELVKGIEINETGDQSSS